MSFTQRHKDRGYAAKRSSTFDDASIAPFQQWNGLAAFALSLCLRVKPKNTNAKAVTLIACALLAACGNKGDLERLASAAPPVVAAGSDQAESAEQQTTPTVEARPARSDELLRRSEERSTDEFDLPPQ